MKTGRLKPCGMKEGGGKGGEAVPGGAGGGGGAGGCGHPPLSLSSETTSWSSLMGGLIILNLSMRLGALQTRMRSVNRKQSTSDCKHLCQVRQEYQV